MRQLRADAIPLFTRQENQWALCAQLRDNLATASAGQAGASAPLRGNHGIGAGDGANKLTSVGTKSYSYDDAGNCTSVYNSATGGTVSMTYDAESRMISASDSASTFSDTYSYNGLDQRVGKVDNTGTFAYTRDGDEVDDAVLADGAAVYNYGANDNSLISENRGGASKYYHSGALGSTGTLTNSSESVTDTHVTDAFGMSIAGSGSTPTPFGFVGQGGYQRDSDTGLTLCGHRYYDSSAGRFLSRDPAQAGNNWYTYCQNDPLNVTDPRGLQTTPGHYAAVEAQIAHEAAIADGLPYVTPGYVPPPPPVPPPTPPVAAPIWTKVGTWFSGLAVVVAVGAWLHPVSPPTPAPPPTPPEAPYPFDGPM